MTYQNLEFAGTITKVYQTQYAAKEDEPQLFSPDRIALTRIEFDQRDSNATYCLEVYAELGSEHVGRDIKLVLSYDKPSDDLRRFTQQITIDGKLTSHEVVKRV